MANISLILYTNVFFGSVLKSPTQMGSLSVNNSVTNISRLGTFKGRDFVTVFYEFCFLCTGLSARDAGEGVGAGQRDPLQRHLQGLQQG